MSSLSLFNNEHVEQWVAGVRGVRIPTGLHKVPPLVFTDEELASLEIPTLLLMGEKEWTCKDPRGALERFRRLVPHGKGEMLEGAGHIVTMDCPERACELVIEHLDVD